MILTMKFWTVLLQGQKNQVKKELKEMGLKHNSFADLMMCKLYNTILYNEDLNLRDIRKELKGYLVSIGKIDEDVDDSEEQIFAEEMIMGVCLSMLEFLQDMLKHAVSDIEKELKKIGLDDDGLIRECVIYLLKDMMDNGFNAEKVRKELMEFQKMKEEKLEEDEPPRKRRKLYNKKKKNDVIPVMMPGKIPPFAPFYSRNLEEVNLEDIDEANILSTKRQRNKPKRFQDEFMY